MDLKQKSTILITCSPGLVEYVRREVEALGYRVGSCHNAGLELIGDQYNAMKLNLLIDFSDTTIEPGEGIIIMNPEYCDRLGEIKQLEQTYQRIGIS